VITINSTVWISKRKFFQGDPKLVVDLTNALIDKFGHKNYMPDYSKEAIDRLSKNIDPNYQKPDLIARRINA